jgi:hypothetical protein
MVIFKYTGKFDYFITWTIITFARHTGWPMPEKISPLKTSKRSNPFYFEMEAEIQSCVSYIFIGYVIANL